MKMNKHYNELKASYLFVDIAHKVAAYQEAHPEKEIIRLGTVSYTHLVSGRMWQIILTLKKLPFQNRMTPSGSESRPGVTS